MISRSSLLMLLLGILAGYAAAGHSVDAQVSALPFDVGDEIWLTYESDRSTPCTVAEIRGLYVRCEPTGRTRIGARHPERWQSLEFVRTIEKQLQ